MNAAEQFAALVAPLTDACADPDELDRLLRELGLLSARQSPLAVPAELAALAETATNTIDTLVALDDPAISAAERIAGLATSLQGLFLAVEELGGTPAGDLGAPFDAPDFWPALAGRLPGYLLTHWLDESHGEIFDALALTGVVGAGTVDFARLVQVAGDPAAQLGAALAADLGVLIEPLRRFVESRGAGARYGGTVEFEGGQAVSGDGMYGDTDGVDARPGPLTVLLIPAPDGLALSVTGLENVTDGIDLGGGWTLTGSGGQGTGGLVIMPEATGPLSKSTLGSAEVRVDGRPEQPWVLLGGAGATRLELAGAWFAVAGEQLRNAPELAITFGTDGLRLVLSIADADSFLATILGSAEVTADLRLSGRWSPADGLSVEGAAALSIHIATSVTIGPITINGLTLTLLVAPDLLTLEITTEVSGRLGPVSAAISGVGLRLMLTPDTVPDAADRVRLGPVGAQLAFKPPNGVGLGLDAGVASGGGYLYFGEATGRYDGVIDLSLLTIGISAVVIIDTRAPDVDGWSMFFTLFLDLPSIQLGFGFTLTGVGGLAGINRTIDTPALEAAVRSGALDTVLFPENAIADAPIIIDQLRAMFPPANDQYVFGPVVRIGWGTPTLIEAEIGVAITLPDPVTVVVFGSVTSVLPTPELDLVALNLDAGGVIDTAAGTLAVDASLHDSHIAWFALSGDMSLRADFTDAPSFLTALGGFHPGFEPPPDFPEVARLRLAIGAPPVLDISFECYLALTSNTVQFGAAFDMSAGVAGFGIAGGSEFDALVFFSPFGLVTQLGYHISVTAAGIDLMGVWLDATVLGPNPWRIIADARFTILGLRESIHLDEQIGSARADPGLAAEDPRDELLAALASSDSWAAAVSGGSPGVLLADSTADEAVIAALPDGRIMVSQQVAPLHIRLDKLGDAPIGTYHTFALEPAPGSLIDTGATYDWFAPGYYVELGANEQLSTPSFEWLAAGLEFGGGDPVAGHDRVTSLDFEEILRDPELDDDRVELGVVDLTVDRPTAAISGGPGSGRGTGFRIAADPHTITLGGAEYAVTDRTTGAVLTRTASWSAAHQSGPGRELANTVVPTWELPT